MVGERVGPYEIVARLGAGGMGEVYRARDTRLGRDVAIKVLPLELAENPDRLRRFEQEAKATAALDHPNILALHDVGAHDGKPYLVEELLEGETLRARLRAGPLGPRKATEIAIAIAHGLAAAHAKGIVHRDLKPENVFLTKDGGVKILDFGLAKLAEPKTAAELATASTVDRETRSGAVLGTLGYLSPEQARGHPVDARSDLFAFGCLLHEMLAGERPFRGDTPLDLVTSLLKDDPPQLPPGVPPPLRQLVLRCLEKQPEDRFSTAHDLALALRALAETSTTGTAPLTLDRLPGRRASIRWLTATLLLALTASAGFWLGRATGSHHGRLSSPAPRLERLTWEAGYESLPALAPDGASFAYVRNSGVGGLAAMDIYFRRVGGETAVNLTADSPVEDTMPDFSPDGQSIVFRSNRDGGGLFVMGATGESVRRLTDFGFEPDWSPDGRTIVFAEERSDVNVPSADQSALWTIDIDTGEKRRVFAGHAVHPAWSPSGARIAFHGSSGPGRYSLRTIAADGTDLVEVLADITNACTQPAWSPGWIWYWYLGHGSWDIWRVPVDDATGRRIGDPEPVTRSGAGSHQPATTPDGRRVAFQQNLGGRNEFSQAGFDPAAGRLLADRRVVTRPRRQFAGWAPSPDGKWLAAVVFVEDGQQDLVLTRVDTGEQRWLTHDPLREGAFVWTPAGDRLLFVLQEPGNEVWSLRTDGSARERVVTTPDTRLTDLLISPDGRWLYVEAEVAGRWEPRQIDLSLPLDQRRPVRLPARGSDRSFSAAARSPDGRWIAGYPMNDQGGAQPSLSILDLETGELRELASLASVQACAWLPDSRRLVLLGQREIRVVDRITGTITTAGWLENGDYPQALSPDGRFIYYSSFFYDHDIWMLDYGDAAASAT